MIVYYIYFLTDNLGSCLKCPSAFTRDVFSTREYRSMELSGCLRVSSGQNNDARQANIDQCILVGAGRPCHFVLISGAILARYVRIK